MNKHLRLVLNVSLGAGLAAVSLFNAPKTVLACTVENPCCSPSMCCTLTVCCDRTPSGSCRER